MAMCNYSPSKLAKLSGVKACLEIRNQHVRHTLPNITYISFSSIMLAVRLDPVETKSMQKRPKSLNKDISIPGQTLGARSSG